MKNAGVKVLVLSFVFVFMFSSLAHAMSYEEFMDRYPNEYIYRVDFPSGSVNYFSSPVELKFELIDTVDGQKLELGKGLRVVGVSASAFWRLGNDGALVSCGYSGISLYSHNENGKKIGFVGNIDIFRWNGNGFFLPVACTFLRPLGGVIRTIFPTGFGILSVMLLVKLLTGFFRRYMLRSL